MDRILQDAALTQGMEPCLWDVAGDGSQCVMELVLLEARLLGTWVSVSSTSAETFSHLLCLLLKCSWPGWCKQTSWLASLQVSDLCELLWRRCFVLFVCLF